MERNRSVSRLDRWEATAAVQASYDGGVDQGGKCRAGEKLLDSVFLKVELIVLEG